MKEKFKKLAKVLEEYNKTAMFILWFLTLILTILASIFWWIIWWSLVWLILLYLFGHYFFWDKITDFYDSKLKKWVNRFWKIKVLLLIIILIVLIFIFFFFSFFNSKPKIFDFTNWLSLKYEEIFNWKDIKTTNDYKRIYEDINNEFTISNNWTKTLNTSSELQRWYSMLQNLKYLKWDRVLIWKFNLKEGWKVWIRFMNTDWFNSEEIKKLHNNECVLQFYKSNKVDEWYWHHVTKNVFLWKESTFKNYNFTNWNYYILAKISWRQFSCYFQKEWENMVFPIIENKNIIFENLWWPVLTRFIQDEKTSPELLGFWLYSK